MSRECARTVTVPAEDADFIDAQVENGAYASTTDVIRAGLVALKDQDEAIEDWLHNVVGPTYDAIKADPSRAHTSCGRARGIARPLRRKPPIPRGMKISRVPKCVASPRHGSVDGANRGPSPRP